jgi:O-methyltransferase
MASRVARQVKDRNLTYLSWRSLRHLERAVDAAAQAEGTFVECGVALGGSAVVICSRMPQRRRFHGYDLFGRIPAPSSPKDDEKSRARFAVIASGKSEGIRGEPYYGYLPDLADRVSTLLEEFGLADRATLHRGLFEDTLQPASPIAFAHLDCDWYDPVRTCLERIYPVLAPGGYLICDDYHNYGGARAAVDEFLETAGDIEIAREIMGERHPDRSTSIVLTRSER